MGVVQIVVVCLLVIGLLAGGGGLASHFVMARPETTVVEGSFTPRRPVTGYGRSIERPLAPVRVSATPTVVTAVVE